jgi:hypothetical protein
VTSADGLLERMGRSSGIDLNSPMSTLYTPLNVANAYEVNDMTVFPHGPMYYTHHPYPHVVVQDLREV